METEIYNKCEACISLIEEEGIYALSMYSSFEKEYAYACWFTKEELIEFIDNLKSSIK